MVGHYNVIDILIALQSANFGQEKQTVDCYVFIALVFNWNDHTFPIKP